MFIADRISYGFDTLTFALSLIPFVLVFALIVASFLEEPLRVRASARVRRPAPTPLIDSRFQFRKVQDRG